MNESPREKQILEKLCQGEKIKNVGPLSMDSRIVLRHIRELTTKDLEGVLGKDKLLDLLTAVRPLFESATQLPDSPSSISVVSQVSNKRLRIRKITAKNFRGLQSYNGPEFSCEFLPESYLLTGLNGTGKSSTLNVIVWALTGQLLWDRGEPSVPPIVDLKHVPKNSGELKTIRSKWPSHVSIPDLSKLKDLKPEPACWVELHLSSDDGSSEVIVRREAIPGKGDIVTGLSSIDPVSIDIAVLMPGRLNHIQFDKDSEIGKVFIEISGLSAIDSYGIFVGSRGITPALTKHINELNRLAEERSTQINTIYKAVQECIPKDLLDEFICIGVAEKNAINRAQLKIEWLKSQSLIRLQKLEETMQLQQNPADMELVELGKRILIAYESIKDCSPLLWSAFQRIKNASMEWNLEAQAHWAEQQDLIKKELNLAIEWYIKQKETKNLKLKLLAAKLLPPSYEPDECPLCEQVLPDNHSLRKELVEFQSVDEIAMKSIDEIIMILKSRLLKTLPDSFSKIEILTLKEITVKEFDTQIGYQLKDKLTHLRDACITMLNRVTDKWELPFLAMDFPHFSNINNPDFSDLVDKLKQFEKEFELSNRKVLLASWAEKSLSDFINEIALILGFNNSTYSNNLLEVLSQANDIAISAKPLQEAQSQLVNALTLSKEYIKYKSELSLAVRLREALEPLESLKSLADDTLIDDLEKIESELIGYYDKLYGGEEFPLRRITSTRVSRSLLLSFWIEFKEVLIEADVFLNASRIRALLWSYVFALSKAGSQHANGDWLDFLVIDDPLTSLDYEHQRNFAGIVFDAKCSQQHIVSSHDLRWPRELQRLSGHNIHVHYLDCFGISKARDVTRIRKGIRVLDEKWHEWTMDDSNIELGRDYVEAARIWSEDELKDILIWANESSRPLDTLGPLITKLEKAYQNDMHYQMEEVKELFQTLRIIESDLQNSHHGCFERNRIMKNEINKAHKEMKTIISCIEKIRQTLQHRLGHVAIV